MQAGFDGGNYSQNVQARAMPENGSASGGSPSSEVLEVGKAQPGSWRVKKGPVVTNEGMKENAWGVDRLSDVPVIQPVTSHSEVMSWQVRMVGVGFECQSQRSTHIAAHTQEKQGIRVLGRGVTDILFSSPSPFLEQATASRKNSNGQASRGSFKEICVH